MSPLLSRPYKTGLLPLSLTIQITPLDLSNAMPDTSLRLIGKSIKVLRFPVSQLKIISNRNIRLLGFIIVILIF